MPAGAPARQEPTIPRPERRPPPTHFHTFTWVVWLAAALAPAALTKNPFYLSLTAVVIALDYLSLPPRAGARSGWGAFLALGAAVATLAALLHPLLVKTGDTTVAVLPALRWKLLEIGGRVSLESLVYGAATGLSLLVILATFATFNAQTDTHLLLRRIPRSLHQTGVVLSIALTFVPQMMVAQREIREAQALRGHRFRRVRDLVPLFVALLDEGLERSLTLAEAMEARGFAGGPAAKGARPARAAVVVGLGLLAGGAFVSGVRPARAWGTWALVAGGALLVGALAALGRGTARSRYRTELWSWRDTAVVAAAAGTLGIFLAVRIGRPEALHFYPYPRFEPPPFDPRLAAALVLLTAPTIFAARRRAGEEEG